MELLATPTFSRVPNAKRGDEIGTSCLTPAFSGAEKREELLRNPCILKGPQRQARGHNQKWLPQRCLLGGPKEGGIATQAVRSLGSPTKGTKSELATSPLPSRGPKRGQNCYATPAFSGVRNKGDKIKTGYLTAAFLGAQKRVALLRKPCVLWGPQQMGQNQNWLPHRCFLRGQKRVECLRNACILGGLQQRGHNQKWLPHPCLLGGAKECRIVTQPLHS